MKQSSLRNYFAETGPFLYSCVVMKILNAGCLNLTTLYTYVHSKFQPAISCIPVESYLAILVRADPLNLHSNQLSGDSRSLHIIIFFANLANISALDYQNTL